MTEHDIAHAPRFDSDNAIYWRRKCGELELKVAELETEIGKLNAVLRQTDKKTSTCE